MTDIHRHQWVHIHRQMHPRKINRMSILRNHHPPPHATTTPMPFRIVINNVTIYCQLPYCYRDRVMHRPMNWVKCYNRLYRPVIYFHAHCAKHRLNHGYFDSIWIGIIRAIVPFVRCYSVDAGLLIRIQWEIICASNTQCNGPKWKRCAHRAARLVVLPILNDQLLIENAFVFVFALFSASTANKFTIFIITYCFTLNEKQTFILLVVFFSVWKIKHSVEN